MDYIAYMLHSNLLSNAVRGDISNVDVRDYLGQSDVFEGIRHKRQGRFRSVSPTPGRPIQTPADFYLGPCPIVWNQKNPA